MNIETRGSCDNKNEDDDEEFESVDEETWQISLFCMLPATFYN